MIVLLGFLSLAVILAQVIALVLLGFAPVALVIGIFPRAGHDFFKVWLGKLATAVFIKALYSLVLAIVVAVSAALADSTSSLGFLFSFALQGIFFWAIFLYRKQITARLVAATTGHYHGERPPQTTMVRQGARAATRPFNALVSMPRRGKDRGDERQQSVLAGDTPPTGGRPAARARGPALRQQRRRPELEPQARRRAGGRVVASSNGHGSSSLAREIAAA